MLKYNNFIDSILIENDTKVTTAKIIFRVYFLCISHIFVEYLSYICHLYFFNFFRLGEEESFNIASYKLVQKNTIRDGGSTAIDRIVF